MSTNILVGITGGIAAYKSVELVRLLRDAGAQVRVVMTEAAQAFITPLTLQAISGHRVFTELFDEEAEAAMGHIELARWADAIVIAPASADTLARLAHGHADDLLTTLCLATKSSLTVAPAMNQHMWQHPATQHNVELLQSRGVKILGPAVGEQACGDVGPGRMLEPEAIVSHLLASHTPGLLKGKRVLITAGPTREPLDPVRFVSNYSSGKMGYALAKAAREQGADVVLISGPTALESPDSVKCYRVETAREMHEAVFVHISDCDIFIATAAVADYAPLERSPHKLKKSAESMQVTMKRNRDILAEVSALPDRPFCVGFAAETEDILAHARRKLEEKRVDLLIANRVGPGIGFEQDDLEVIVLGLGCEPQVLPCQSKGHLAHELIAILAKACDTITC